MFFKDSKNSKETCFGFALHRRRWFSKETSPSGERFTCFLKKLRFAVGLWVFCEIFGVGVT